MKKIELNLNEILENPIGKRISNKEFRKKAVQKSFQNDSIIPKGKARIQICDISSPEAKALQTRVVELSQNGSWEDYCAAKRELFERFGSRSYMVTNTVTRKGRQILAMILKGDNTYSGEINFCALGTGSNASSTSDLVLQQEKFRKQVSSTAYGTYHTYVSTFFTAGETSGTYKEIGHFIDATTATDSGQLFSRIADPETSELPITKALTESLTIDYEVTL